MIELTGEWQEMPQGKVRARVVERVAWLELQEEPANSYSYAMMRDLDEAVLACRFDEGVDVLVISGAGEKFFCAGADIGMLQDVTPRWKYSFCLHANETLLRLEHTPKLVIAALNGHCVGGGLEVALAADLRLAKATPAGGKGGRIGLPEVKLGVLPGTGGTQRLARLVGASRAMKMMVEAATYSPEEALAEGLVHELLAAEGFGAAVQAYAARFTLPHAPTMAVGHIKRAVQSGADLPLESGLALERELQQRLFDSADAKEGLAAFLEKRAGKFQGR